jgi:hypothetical protein
LKHLKNCIIVHDSVLFYFFLNRLRPLTEKKEEKGGRETVACLAVIIIFSLYKILYVLGFYMHCGISLFISHCPFIMIHIGSMSSDLGNW